MQIHPAARRLALAPALLLASALSSACIDDDTAQGIARTIQLGSERPDELPRMLNSELPFRYPPELYAAKVQGNVDLRLFIDSTGSVRPESTMVHASSGHAALDSAAVQGARELRFVPAKREGVPMPVAIVFPVFFRHPEAGPLPGDTILRRGTTRPGPGVPAAGAGAP